MQIQYIVIIKLSLKSSQTQHDEDHPIKTYDADHHYHQHHHHYHCHHGHHHLHNRHHYHHQVIITIIIVLIIIDPRYDVMNPHNLYSLLVEKLLVHETGQKLTKNQNDRNTHIKIITNMHKCQTSDVILP